MPGASDLEVFFGALKFIGGFAMLWVLWEIGKRLKARTRWAKQKEEKA